ncbi:MAG: PilZ domain-containing protein [Gammaproteobacteria bacterium]|nr:PilZ domain-containing protein [Gammaproteobacteria bacterium]MDH3767281.1 PilZ domain-containing protein [Gammaproteobacteria bacterium]
MDEANNKRPSVDEKRRDQRINVGLPFLLTDPEGSAKWECKTLDISPTGILLEVEKEQAPVLGSIVDVSVQGPAEAGWEHINTRSMRVVRVQAHQTGLTYVDLDTV